MMYTVVGAYCDGARMAFGAIEGKHQVSGDLEYDDYQPFADHVEASSAQEAMEMAQRC